MTSYAAGGRIADDLPKEIRGRWLAADSTAERAAVIIRWINDRDATRVIELSKRSRAEAVARGDFAYVAEIDRELPDLVEATRQHGWNVAVEGRAPSRRDPLALLAQLEMYRD